MQDGELRDRLVRVETKVESMQNRQDKMDLRFDRIEELIAEVKTLISDRSGFVKGALWIAGAVGAFVGFSWEWIQSHWRW